MVNRTTKITDLVTPIKPPTSKQNLAHKGELSDILGLSTKYLDI